MARDSRDVDLCAARGVGLYAIGTQYRTPPQIQPGAGSRAPLGPPAQRGGIGGDGLRRRASGGIASVKWSWRRDAR